jgi:hypothetical protein
MNEGRKNMWFDPIDETGQLTRYQDGHFEAVAVSPKWKTPGFGILEVIQPVGTYPNAATASERHHIFNQVVQLLR